MFLKKITVFNFKCLKGKHEFNFSFPDQTKTGLNVFIGENNTGKSTLFEAINFLRNGPGLKDINDLKNNTSPGEQMYVEAIFTGDIRNLLADFSDSNSKKFEDYVYVEDKQENLKICRFSDENKFKINEKEYIVGPKEICVWDQKNNNYANPSGIDKAFTRIFEIDFIWADTNPDDIVNFGSTKVCGKLLSKVTKNFIESPGWIEFQKVHKTTFQEGSDSLSARLIDIEEKVQKIVTAQFSDIKIKFDFRLPESDSFFKNTKIIVDDGSSTIMEEKGSGLQRAVALALLQVYASDLVKHPENEKLEKPFFLFIDEPELCLHPKAQFTLLSALKNIAKDKQIFFTTHSPFMFKGISIDDTGMFGFLNDEKNIKTNKINPKIFKPIFNEPSWNQINYYLYNLDSSGFHDEIYSYIEENFGDAEKVIFSKTNSKINYIRKNNNGSKEKTERISLSTYIRHQIHHSENKFNRPFTDIELHDSIIEMLSLI